MVTNLTANFVGFLLLPSKVHADVKAYWQCRKAKIATKSEMYVKYGHAIFLKDKYEYKHRLSIKTAPQMTQKGRFSRRFCYFMHVFFLLLLFSVSAQSYEFCPCLRKLDVLDFTLSHMQTLLVNCQSNIILFYYSPFHVGMSHIYF